MKRDVYISAWVKHDGGSPTFAAWLRTRRGKPGGLDATWRAIPEPSWARWLVARVGTDWQWSRAVCADQRVRDLGALARAGAITIAVPWSELERRVIAAVERRLREGWRP